MPAEYLAGLAYDDSESLWARILSGGHNVLIAEDRSGDVVGFASGGPVAGGDTDHRAEIYAIYVLEGHQGKGVGRCLVRAVARQLQESGFTSLLVWVLENNNAARRFYESLGGELAGQKRGNIGGTDVVEVSYSWENIGSLTVPPAV